MTDEDATAGRIAERVLTSRRYQHVDAGLVRRIVADEMRRHRTEAEAVKRVKRRLHQAVGAYRPAPMRGDAAGDPLSGARAAWHGDLRDPAFVSACGDLLARHASTRERLPSLDAFYADIWDAVGGPPDSILDLGCGLEPLALPWMGLPATTAMHAIDVDTAQLAVVDGFLSLVGQPHVVEAMDLAAALPATAAPVALLLKLVPLLDRQDRGAAARLVAGLQVGHAVISLPRHSLGGRGKGMERTHRQRLERLVADLGDRVVSVTEASIPNELVFVLALRPPDG